MSRDRLPAMRAQQQGGYGGNFSYPAQTAGGGGGRAPNLYAEQSHGYEMEEVQNSHTHLTGNTGDDMSVFYSEITAIQDNLRTFNDNVSRISDLHSRSLNNMDEAATQRNGDQLDGLVEETSALSNQLKSRIKSLQKSGSGRDGQIRKQQAGLVKQKFVESIQNYQQVEQQYRSKYKQRMERQLKIVKPDATPEEVSAVINDDQGGQIFAQALQSSNRYGESRAAYREVQERHEDLKRIERTLGELAQLFNDTSILVEQQDETTETIQTATINVGKDTEAGLQHTDKAVASARSARKKRWICFVIFLVILAIIGIAIGIKFAIDPPKSR